MPSIASFRRATGGTRRFNAAWVKLGLPVAIVLGALVFAPAAAARHYPVKAPKNPTFISCSSAKKQFLREAWWEAYRYMNAAESLMDHLASQPRSARIELWSRDNGTDPEPYAPSPQRFFGDYTDRRFEIVRTFIKRARARFEGGDNVPIRFMGCNDNHCTSNPEAFHAPRKSIYLCPKFWDVWRDRGFLQPPGDALSYAAHTLVHETFHWRLWADGSVVKDWHGKSRGGIPHKKYYGMTNVTRLAEDAPWEAIYNNDTYAFFTQAVKRAPEPTYVGIFTTKESAGTGALYVNQSASSMDKLNRQLTGSIGAQQYLADVEVYQLHRQTRYAGLWRIGSGGRGPDSMYSAERNAFEADRAKRRATQDLIDIEISGADGQHRFVGVYRTKEPGHTGNGALRLGLSLAQLNQLRAEFADLGAYLADVEIYTDNGAPRLAGLWLVGTGGKTQGLVLTEDQALFAQLRNQLGATQQLIDYERHGDLQIGVWREVPSHTQFRIGFLEFSEFRASWLEGSKSSTMIDLERRSSLAADVVGRPSGSPN